MPHRSPRWPCARSAAARLLLASAALLFAELVVVRWTGSELRQLAYFKNLVVIAAFLGAGIGIAIGGRRPRLVWLTALILPLAAIVPRFSHWEWQEGLKFGSASEMRWSLQTAATLGESLAFLALFVAIYLLCVALFIGFGAAIGLGLRQVPGLVGYGWNLAGSLLGVLAFTLVSGLQAPPTVWLVVLAAVQTVAAADRRTALGLGGVTAAAALLTALTSEPARWSPYSRIEVHTWGLEGERPIGYDLSVNRSYFMTMLDLSRSTSGVKRLEDARLHYDLPYQLSAPRRVLVLGAGAGNDVAAALRAGARQVDAVEIDPAIVDIGRTLHPERPYAAPGVRVITDDARSFLRRTDQRYDLIVFALLDSHTLLAGMPGVRLDNYVYTVEAMRDARRLLSDRGLLVLSFAVADSHRWVARKLYRVVEEAFESPPRVLEVGYDLSYAFLAGPGLEHRLAERTLVRQGARERTLEALADTHPEEAADGGSGADGGRDAAGGSDADGGSGAAVDVPTDDWPHLYLRARGIPPGQLTLLVMLIVVSLAITRLLAPAVGRLDPHFALLGTGFLLMETKGISDLGLLFGGTWWTVTAAFASVLALSLASVLYVAARRPTRRAPVYAGLFLVLLLAWAIRPGHLISLPLPLAQTLGALLFAAPVFFSGIIFAISLKRVDDTAKALSSNLLGSVLGGFLEYISLAWGIRALSLVGIAVYALSAVALTRR